MNMEDITSEHQPDFLLGIDIGTTNCKVAVGDRHGRILHAAALPCRLEYPGPGLVEVDPEKGWWQPLLRILKTLLDRAGIDGKSIRGVGVSCTNGLVCLDGSGRPVRNAIMQIDRRTEAICLEIQETIGRDEILRVTGNRVAPGTSSAPSLLWIRSEEPDRYKEIDTILSPAGYIVHRFTDRRVMDRTRAATTLLYDIRNGSWSDRMLGFLEIPDRLLPPILSPVQAAGEITRAAADLTGLSAGTPVVAGVMDSIAAAIGMGTTTPGEVGIVLGTVGRVLWPLENQTFDDRFLNIPLVEPDRWMSIACTNATSLSVTWFIRSLIASKRSSATRNPLEIFDTEAAESPPGSRGILYLPYLAGERSPIWNPRARGVFFGLDRAHTRGDLARSVMEGTAFSIRENLEILEAVTGRRPETIRLSGGGSRSPIWPEILSSVLDRDIEISRQDNSECAGALRLSAVGAGMIDGNGILSRRPSENNRRVSADREAGKIYDELYGQYKDLYTTLEPHFNRLHNTITKYGHEEDPSS